MVKKLALLLNLTASVAAAAPVSLSQKDVAELILKQGPKTKEVTYNYDQKRATLLNAYSLLDWNVQLDTGWQWNSNENLTTPLVQGRYESYITTATLSKQLLSGTNLSVQAGRTSQKSNIISPTIYPQLEYDYLGLNIEQSLWGNSFGYGDRARINAAENSFHSDMILRTNDLQGLVTQALQAFWNTYVAQEQFREALASRDRYEKLVATVRRKTGLGYSQPGELSQVQAEYEGQVQQVKSASATYLQQLDALLTLLGLPAGTEVNFVTPKQLPPVPKLTPKPVDQLRTVRSQELRVKAADNNLTAARSNLNPTFNLVGKVNNTGVDPASEAAFSELTSGTHPQYYAGVKFAYKFGSGVLSETVRANQAALSLEETKLQRIRDEQRDALSAAERQVGANYAIVTSSIQQRTYRQRAVAELTRSYNQGRTDITTLILQINALVSAEVQTIQAIGNYYIALNQWAATRDELIPDQKEENP